MPEAIGLIVLMILEPVRLEATRLTDLPIEDLRLVVLLLRAIGLLETFLLLIVFLLVENLDFAIRPNRLSFALCFADLMQTTPDMLLQKLQSQKLKRLFVLLMNQSHRIENHLIYQR